MYTIVILLIIQFGAVYNENTKCGCNINREQTKNVDEKFSSCEMDSELKHKCFVDHENRYTDSKRNKLDGYDMVLLQSGDYQVGTDDIIIESDVEGPKRILTLKAFYLDKHEVSNSDFSLFAKETKYKTEAETFGDSFVFLLFLNNTFREQLVDYRVAQAPWWYKVTGANWSHPHGPDSSISDILDHPVIHVSWNDARAYCAWRNARLPTEAEWEAACRGGHRDTKYPWGDKLFPDRKHMANIWQGTFPNHNSQKDGYLGTNPVNEFPPNDYGLYNMAGNVWEWTEDSWAENKPKEKVKKGGSFLCHRSYCYRYRCSARSHNTDDSSAGNLGFRCAKSVE